MKAHCETPRTHNGWDTHSTQSGRREQLTALVQGTDLLQVVYVSLHGVSSWVFPPSRPAVSLLH